MKNLAEKKILITGATSDVGRALCHKLVKAGSTVLILDNDLDSAQDLARTLRSSGGRAFAFFVDLASVDSIKKCKADISAKGFHVDILINNAGVAHRGDFEKVSLEKHFEMYKVNVEAVVAMTHVFFSDLRQSREAHLVNIARVSGFVSFPYGSTYTSSKSAAVHFSESLRKELIERSITNIKITTVCPTFIDMKRIKKLRTPFITQWITADFIADKIIEGIRHNKEHVKEPFIVKGIDFLKGVLPFHAFVFLTKYLDAPKGIIYRKGRES